MSNKLGSFISKKGNQGLKVMLAAHMDEVGFIVKRIDDKGYIYFQPVGGWWPQVLLAQQVIITTYKGKEIFGFIGCKPPHVLKAEKRKEMVQIEDMFIDLGVSSKQEVIDLGIQIGDMITPKTEYRKMNNDKYLFGKAMDNRIGCAIVVDVMKRLDNPSNQIYGVATVQEEVGLRGATTCANLINPDIAIVSGTSAGAAVLHTKSFLPATATVDFIAATTGSVEVIRTPIIAEVMFGVNWKFRD